MKKLMYLLILYPAFSYAGMATRTPSVQIYVPDVPITVYIHVMPSFNTKAWAIEETPPELWRVVDQISDDGVFNAGVIKWGIFYGTKQKTLSYRIMPTKYGQRVKTFKGKVSFDGVSQPITGISKLGRD